MKWYRRNLKIIFLIFEKQKKNKDTQILGKCYVRRNDE